MKEVWKRMQDRVAAQYGCTVKDYSFSWRKFWFVISSL